MHWFWTGSSWQRMDPLERRMLITLIIDYLVKTISLLSTITSHYLNIKPVHKYTILVTCKWYNLKNIYCKEKWPRYVQIKQHYMIMCTE